MGREFFVPSTVLKCQKEAGGASEHLKVPFLLRHWVLDAEEADPRARRLPDPAEVHPFLVKESFDCEGDLGLRRENKAVHNKLQPQIQTESMKPSRRLRQLRKHLLPVQKV